MTITRKEIDKLARLSALHFSDEEITRLEHSLQSILPWVSELQKMDTSMIESSVVASETFIDNIREDVVSDGKISDDILQNAPERQLDYFAVPKVIE